MMLLHAEQYLELPSAPLPTVGVLSTSARIIDVQVGLT
jgi:hypothetical protein